LTSEFLYVTIFINKIKQRTLNLQNTLTKINTSVSDRILFKRCRRKWDFTSKLRQNLEPRDSFSPSAFFGTGIHFALEDFHGYNLFGHPIAAFQAYYDCFDRETELNIDCEALAALAPGMFNYYIDEWMPTRKKFRTYIYNGIPQVEVRVILELKDLSKQLGLPVYYSMVFDRIVEDDEGRLWIMDFKTVTQFDIAKLETDPQISTYSWGAELYYKRPIEGFVYLQFKKKLVDDPKILKNGDISVDKSQNTNYYRYLELIKFKFGNVNSAPEKYVECLNELLMEESEYGDKYIRYDLVRRNEYSRKKEYGLIKMEILDMMAKDVRIYPNPTAQCKMDCLFRNACIALDDGGDSQYILDNNFKKVEEGTRDKWKKKLIYPKQINTKGEK
jgi:hypothetical protein